MKELALRYATALYEISLENKALDSYQEECKIVSSILDENEEFIDVLSSAFLSIEEKNKMIEDTFINVNQDIISLVKIVVANHRVNILKDIFVSFNSLANQYKGIVEGLLYSAFPLEKSFVSSIEEAISKRENRKISLIAKVDPSLLGGIKVVINNKVYDGSVKNKIFELKRNLINKEENLL